MDVGDISKSTVAATLANPSVGNVLGGSNLLLVVGLSFVLRDAAMRQDERAEETQTAVARVEVKVDSMSTRFAAMQEELAALKQQVARLQEQGATTTDVHALEARVSVVEDCIRDRRRCRLPR